MNEKDKAHRIELLNTFPKNSIGAEIGVWKGEMSGLILEVVQPNMLYLIDVWEFDLPKGFGQLPEGYGAKNAKKNQKAIDEIYIRVCSKFLDKNNVTITKGFSKDVAKTLEDESLDWVYIDANHEYFGVLEDLTEYYPKVKPGGIVSGHDWTYPIKEKRNPVQDAIRDFWSYTDVNLSQPELFGTNWKMIKEK